MTVPTIATSATTTEIGHNTASVTLLTSVARTATLQTPTQTNANSRGLLLYLNLTAAPNTAETLTVQLQVQDPISSNWVDLSAFVALPAGSTLQSGPYAFVFELYPGAAVGGMPAASASPAKGWQVASRALPGTWRAAITHSSTGSWTYSVAAMLEQ